MLVYVFSALVLCVCVACQGYHNSDSWQEGDNGAPRMNYDLYRSRRRSEVKGSQATRLVDLRMPGVRPAKVRFSKSVVNLIAIVVKCRVCPMSKINAQSS